MSQNGKGDRNRVSNHQAYSEGYDRIFRKPITCDICGQFVSHADLDSGAAVRRLVTSDSDYSSEEYETYHVTCTKPQSPL